MFSLPEGFPLVLQLCCFRRERPRLCSRAPGMLFSVPKGKILNLAACHDPCGPDTNQFGGAWLQNHQVA